MNKLIIVLLLVVSHAAAQPVSYQAGVHYLEIANPIKVDAKPGQRGEVLIFFKYTCPACYQLHPHVEAWEAGLSDDITVKKVAVFQPEVYSKAFYAADILGVNAGFHEEIYKKLHQDRKPLRRMTEFAELAEDYGVGKEAFVSTANSFSVNMKVKQGEQTAGRAQVPGTPFILVNGKYLLSGKMLGSNVRMLEVADKLLSGEHLSEGG